MYKRQDLGSDTYAHGKISNEKIDDLCHTLKEFAQIMESYKVTAYKAYGTSAIRETENTPVSYTHLDVYKRQGMDIVDIGGESTRSGYTLLSDEEEIARVVPMIEVVKANFDLPISLDTYKSGVAEAGIRAGADLINDIWGLKYDNRMAEVIRCV